MSDIRDYEPLWGTWQVESQLGQGSFGKVYKVSRSEFLELGTTTYSAVKIISIPSDESEIRQMRIEGLEGDSLHNFFHNVVAGIISEIDMMIDFRGNSHIVSFEDYMVIDKSTPSQPGWDILIRMELLENLSDLVVKTPLPTAEVVKLGVHICRALALCAKKNIIHRDIKHDNIFVSQYGDYKLGDFGIARHIERTASGHSKKGTYTSMAPEVYKGAKYGASVDTYSLGIVLYSLLNQNRNPFLPEYPNPIRPEDRDEALQRRMDGDPLPVLKNISPELNAIILRACAFAREDRFPNSSAMLDALETFANQEGYELGVTMTPSHESDSCGATPSPNKSAPPEDNKKTNPIILQHQENLQRQANSEHQENLQRQTNAKHQEILSAGKPKTTTRIPMKALIATLSVAMTLALIVAGLIFLFNPSPDTMISTTPDKSAHKVPKSVSKYAISIDGQTELFFSDKEAAQAALDGLTKHYADLAAETFTTITSVTFAENVGIIDSMQVKTYPQKVKDAQNALQDLISHPYLHVIVEGTQEVEEEIDYQVEVKKDPTLPMNSTDTQRSGEKGKKSSVWTCISSNGIMIEQSFSEAIVTKPPVNEVILQGTKAIVSNHIGKRLTNKQLAAMIQDGTIPKNVTRLDLSDNNISDLTSLSALTNLTELYLWKNPVSDLTPLRSLTKLTILDLTYSEVFDIAPLSSLTEITDLYLNGCYYLVVQTLAPVKKLPKLKTLELYHCRQYFVNPDATNPVETREFKDFRASLPNCKIICTPGPYEG